MFDNTNHYYLRTELVEGITHYYVSFTGGQAINKEAEVSRPVYLEFLRFIKTERNLRRWDERHTEHCGITDEIICNRALYPPDNVEDMAFDSMLNAQLRQAMEQLPEIQRRRFVLYHEFGLTYEQIAKIEGCKRQSVYEAVFRAEKEIKEKIKNFCKLT